MRVLEAHQARLAQKIGNGPGSELKFENLNRDLLVVVDMLGDIHLAKRALTKQAHQTIIIKSLSLAMQHAAYPPLSTISLSLLL